MVAARARARAAPAAICASGPEGGEQACDKGWERSGSRLCCKRNITDFFKARHFEELFPRRNDTIAHAAGFWDYPAFIAAAALFEPRGFGTTGGKEMGVREVAAFLAHVGASTSCGRFYPNPMAWGLCYKREMSPYQNFYCDDSNELYRCVEGLQYYGRGGEALFLFTGQANISLSLLSNYNYGIIGKGIKQDLLSHPELLQQNATLAFEAAIWRWMTPVKWRQPSAHDAFVGNWKPSKNDPLSKRYPGFGTTMNIMRGDRICGQGFTDEMNNTISHYIYYLGLMGVNHEHSGRSLDCADQVVFNPSSKSLGS
ncbi:Chitinase-like protein 1 [Triticum urartu]|uniref:chitinase n=1 Tax=Triticum urartu TaxID=4572 RepID=M7YYR0_TRIUA|nr:Chitinase-like protein 1 [Triticum urartu]